MAECYRNYGWIKGVPKGLDCLESCGTLSPTTGYRIVTDPYHKRYSVERYDNGRFSAVVYDSMLLDFRHIKPAQQQGWTQETASANEDAVTCIIRNPDDRIIYLETHLFEGNVCRECQILSPQGLLLATNRMYYKQYGDLTDGVVLYDRQEKPVMYKTYVTGEDGQFTDLVEERWDLVDLCTFHRSFPQRKETAQRDVSWGGLIKP